MIVSVTEKLKGQLALHEVATRLKSRFLVARLLLFGSVARGEATEDSDADVLVITQKRMSHEEKHAMVDVVFEVNLEYGSNISILVVDKQSWDAGHWSLLALHDEVSREGIPL